MSKKKSGMQIYTKQDKAILYCGYALLLCFSRHYCADGLHCDRFVHGSRHIAKQGHFL